jgi:hypothetical protein
VTWVSITRVATHVSGTHHAPDLLHRVQVGAQTTMHGEDLLVNDGGNWQTIEAIGEGLPELNVVSPLALIVKAVDAVDGGALVVAAKHEEVLGVLDLVRKQQADSLQRLLAAIDIVTEEEVVRFGWEAAVLEQTEQVVVLAMYITADLERPVLAFVHAVQRNVDGGSEGTDLYGRLKLEQNGLRDEDFARLGAQIADLRLQQLHLLSRPATSDL